MTKAFLTCRFFLAGFGATFPCNSDHLLAAQASAARWGGFGANVKLKSQEPF